MRSLCFLTALAPLVLAACVLTRPTPTDRAALLALHAALIEAHLQNDLSLWQVTEADTVLAINRGRLVWRGTERWAGRAVYLDGAVFSVYRDIRRPVVRISDDGTLGWLAAEVEAKGTLPDGEGGRRPFHVVWAWVELYQKTDGGWRLVGNASNEREPDS